MPIQLFQIIANEGKNYSQFVSSKFSKWYKSTISQTFDEVLRMIVLAWHKVL